MRRLAGLARNAVQLFVYVTTAAHSSILKIRFMLLNEGYEPYFKVQWVLSNEIHRYIPINTTTFTLVICAVGIHIVSIRH